MKIKFIYPPVMYASIRNEIEPSPPLGIAQLASVLQREGYSVAAEDLSMAVRVRKGRYKDFDLPSTVSARDECHIETYVRTGKMRSRKVARYLTIFEETCAFTSFDLIGFSVLDRAQFLWALFMARYCFEKKIPVIFGGSYMNTIGHMYVDRYEVITYFLEGGSADSLVCFLKFLEGKIPIGKVPDLWYRSGGKIERNARAPYDVESAPLPDFGLFDLDLYRAPIGDSPRDLILRYQMSSGCSNHCAFCNDHTVSLFQHKSVEKVLKELEALSKKYDAHTFIFSDTSLYLSYDFLDRLCTGLMESGLRIRWGGMTAIVDKDGKRLDERLIKKMSDSGCHFLHISPETGDEQLRYSLAKKVSNEDFTYVLKTCREANLFMIVNFVYGFPYEDDSSLERTIGFIDENKDSIDAAVVVSFYVAYNSPYYKYPERYNIQLYPAAKTIFHRPFYAFREVHRFSWQERRRYFRKYARLDRFVFEKIMMRTIRIPKFVPFFVYRFILNARYKNNIVGRLIGCLMPLMGSKRSKLYAHPYLFKFNKKYLARKS